MSGPNSRGAESGAGFVSEAEENGAGVLVGAHVGGQDVGVTQSLAGFILELNVVSAEKVVPPFANDTAEGIGQLLRVLADKIVAGEDSGGIEPCLHAFVDSGEFC